MNLVVPGDFDCCTKGNSCLNNDAPSVGSQEGTTTTSNSDGGSPSIRSQSTAPIDELGSRSTAHSLLDRLHEAHCCGDAVIAAVKAALGVGV